MRDPRSRVSNARHRLVNAARGDAAMFGSGAVLSRLARMDPPASLAEAEFRVFSQWNEDGIIDHVVGRCDGDVAPVFVEIGAGDYRESNTRFLAMLRGWSGSVIDSGAAHADFIRRSEMDWRYGVRAVTSMVTAENVVGLLPAGEIGLLSLDVDGVDYWILRAVLEEARPGIIVCEYQALFGPSATVTVPYRDDFSWDADPSWHCLYFGASLGALAEMVGDRGYRLVGCESHGVNAFFVRDDLADGLPSLPASEAFRTSRAPVYRSTDGTTEPYLTDAEKLAVVADLPVWDTVAQRTVTVSNALRAAGGTA